MSGPGSGGQLPPADGPTAWILEATLGERLVEEQLLVGITDREIHRIFRVEAESRPAGPFLVTPEAAQALRPLLHRSPQLERYLYSVVLVEGGMRENRYRHWRAKPRAVIPPHLFAELMRVRPSVDGEFEYRPCQVTLKDGSTMDRVYVAEARSYFRSWGVAPEDDSGKSEVALSDVMAIRESPSRLSPALAEKMYRAGESGMGYCVFRLVLVDGRHLDCLTGNAVDFIEWPAGISPRLVRDLLPHAGNARLACARVGGARYSWCLYEPPRPTGHSPA